MNGTNRSKELGSISLQLIQATSLGQVPMVAARGSPYLKGWESGVTCQIIQMWLPDLMVKWDPILRCGRNDGWVEGHQPTAFCSRLIHFIHIFLKCILSIASTASNCPHDNGNLPHNQQRPTKCCA